MAYVLNLEEPAALALLTRHAYSVDAAISASFSALLASDPRSGMTGDGNSFTGVGSQPSASGRSTSSAAPSSPSSSAQALGPGAAAAAAQDSCHARQCMICFDDIGPGTPDRLPCGHATCDACWRGMLRAKLDEGKLLAGSMASVDAVELMFYDWLLLQWRCGCTCNSRYAEFHASALYQHLSPQLDCLPPLQEHMRC